MTIQPKAEFQKTSDSKVLSDIVATAEFSRSLNATLLEYVNNQHMTMKGDGDVCKAEDVALRVAGAIGFVNTLLSMSGSPKTPQTTIQQNLKH